jgi:maltooligosyltrehalose trehalohydrolase
VHAHLTGERQGYYVDFGAVRDFPRLFEKTFLLDGIHSRLRDRRHGAPVGDLPGDCFVVSIQNHDQVGNRAAGDRLSTLLPPPAARLAASLMLLAPHVPLLFMGEEYGETRPFPFFCSFSEAQLVRNVREGRRREFAEFAWQGDVPDPQAEATFAAACLSWSWPAGSVHAGMRELYRDLLRARRTWAALRDFRHRTAHLHDGTVLELVRGLNPSSSPAAPSSRAAFALHVFFNLAGTTQPLVQPASKDGPIFCSEAPQYAGARRQGELVRDLLPFECVVFGPMNQEEIP